MTFTAAPAAVVRICTLLRVGFMPGAMSSTSTRFRPRIAHHAYTNSDFTHRNLRPTHDTVPVPCNIHVFTKRCAANTMLLSGTVTSVMNEKCTRPHHR